MRKFDALLLQSRDGGEDVVGGEGDVLDAGAVVEVEVLFDLRFAAAFGGLVDGELDVAVAVGHDFGHERGVFGGDVVVVEVLVEREAHDLGVEVDPLVHGVPADVADDVVDVEQADGAGDGVFGHGAVAGQEGAGVVVALDEGVERVAVGGDAGDDDVAVFVGEGRGLFDGALRRGWWSRARRWRRRRPRGRWRGRRRRAWRRGGRSRSRSGARW